MKQGWEYKKLGDICNVINGLWTGKKEPFINVAVIRNTNFSKDCQLNLENVAYIDVEAKQFASRKLLCGDIIIEKSGGSEKQPVGRPILFNISDGDYSFSNFTSTLRIKENAKVNSSFLHKCLYAFYLKGETFKLQSKTTGLHNLNMKGYLRSTIPLPPKSIQLAIVSELDKINELIRLKKDQLKDYDNLAQSIFYEMFGDPVENEKGWEVTSLENVCSSIVRGPFGSALKKEFFVLPDDTNYKVYEQKHAIQKDANIGNYYVTVDKFKELSRFEVKAGDIIMSCSGTIGELFVIPSNAEKGLMNQALLKFTLNDYICKDYFLFLMESVKKNFTIRGTGLQNIGSVKIIKVMKFGLPPLPLQHLFAQRIEQIEHQKSEVTKVITDLKTLLASRMQHWFE